MNCCISHSWAANKTLLSLTSFAGTHTRGRFAIIAPCLITQILAVLVYFLVLNYSVFWAFIYASFFAVAAPFSLRRALSSHASDNRFIFTAITIATDMLAVIFAFANAYQIYGGVVVNGVAAIGFADHLYFSVVTFTTLGYGDFLPTGTTRFIATFEALLGYAYFAVIIGLSASLFYEHLRKT